MEKMTGRLTQLITGWQKTKLVLALCACTVFLVLLCASGGSLWAFLLVGLAAVFYIVLPGRFWRRVLRLDDFLPGYAFPLDLMLGVGTLAVCLCVAVRLDMHWLLQLVQPACGIAGLAVFRSDNCPLCTLKQNGFAGLWARPRAWFTGQRLLLVLLTAALLFVYGWCGAVKYTHASVAGEILANHDFLWNVGNAESFLIQFPPEDLRFYDVRLTYHYLTEMVTAALSFVTGVTCYDILAFYQQPLTLCALVACLHCFGCFFFRREDGTPHTGKALLFTFSPFLFACASLWAILPNGWSEFWTTNIIHLVTNINSQATLIIHLTVFSALFLQAAKQKFRIGFVPFAAIAASFALLCFAKGPAAAIVACAVVLTVLLLLVQKKAGWRGILLALAVGGTFLVVYLTMFSSGPATSVSLSPAGTMEKCLFGDYLFALKAVDYNRYRLMLAVLVPVQAVLMLPAAMPLVLAGACKDLRRLFRLDGDILFASACAAGGTLAYFLYNHPAMSQIYFFLLAIFFLNLLAIRQLHRLPVWWSALTGRCAALRTALRRGWVVCIAALAAVGMLTAVFTYVNLCGSGLRQLLRNYDVMEKYPYDCVLTADDEAAALWLRENTDADICMFATNRIHTGARNEGVSNIYSAISARQGFMEGFQYAVTNMGVSEAVVNERTAVNEALFSAQTDAQTIRTLCERYGITHLLFSRQMAGDESQLQAFPCVYNGSDVRIYEIFPGK